MRKYLLVAAVIGALLTLSIPAAQAGTGGEHPPSGVVSATPVTSTPHLLTSTSSTRADPPDRAMRRHDVRRGHFTAIKKGSTTYTRTDIFSFSASSPYTVTSWAPRVVGSTTVNEDGAAAINSIAFNGTNCRSPT